MPSDLSAKNRVYLGVEALEARDVPSSFGANRGLSIDMATGLFNAAQTVYVTGTGPGTRAHVRAFTESGKLVYSFFPFGQYTGGVYVRSGDFNGDGRRDLVVSTAGGTTGLVKVYTFQGGGIRLLGSFQPFGPNYTGGVELARGANVTGNAQQELIVGQQTGGSRVKVYSYDSFSSVPGFVQVRSFDAFESGYLGGVSLDAAQIDQRVNSPLDPYNYNYAEVIVGKASGSAQISIFDVQLPTPVLRATYSAFNPGTGGVNIVAGDTDQSRGAEIYVNLKGTSTIRAFDGETGSLIATVQAYPPTYAGMLNMAIGPSRNGGGGLDLIVVAADGAYAQVPLVFPGGPPGSPAPLNGTTAP